MKNSKVRSSRIPVTAAAAAAWPVTIQYRPPAAGERRRSPPAARRFRLIRRSGSGTVTVEAVDLTAARPGPLAVRRSAETTVRI